MMFMHDGRMVDLFLWSAQGFLSLFFFFAGAPKVLGRGIDRWTGFSDLPRPLVVFIGITEILGAAGLVLPMSVRTLPWLTPLAAVGLAVVVLMASGFHLRADERLPAVETALWAALASVVAAGRWHTAMQAIVLPAWFVITSVSVLIPALILNIVILLRRPVPAAPVRSDVA